MDFMVLSSAVAFHMVFCVFCTISRAVVLDCPLGVVVLDDAV